MKNLCLTVCIQGCSQLFPGDMLICEWIHQSSFRPSKLNTNTKVYCTLSVYSTVVYCFQQPGVYARVYVRTFVATPLV